MNPQKAVKMILADLSYLSGDDYGQAMPLSVGYVGAYLKHSVMGVDVEIFKDPDRLFDAIVGRNEDYSFLALSNYAWNFQLNRNFMELAKRMNPGVVTIMGGPNIDADSDAGLLRFFKSLPALDFYVPGEGEYRFAALIRSLVANGMDIRAAWDDIPKTVAGFDRKSEVIIKGSAEDPGPCDCGTLPSPYLTGILDDLFNDPRLVPVIETNRGCPYSCAYCCWGNAINSGMRLFDMQRVVDELRYISTKSKHPMNALYVADGNFGILERDRDIAGKIKELNANDGSFGKIYLMCSKNLHERIVDIGEMLKDITDISMSKQSLNPAALGIIGRENVPDIQYDRVLSHLKERGVSTYCELIYGLPGESYESFMDGMEKMYRKDLNIALYPLLLFKGARINSEEFREKYGIKSAFRIMSRYAGSYGEIHSAEYEEILVSHSELPEEDFMKIRVVFLLHAIFAERMFEDLAVYLKGKDIYLASFFRFIIEERGSWPDTLEDLVDRFESDVKRELVGEKALKTNFTGEEIRSIKENTLDLNVYYMCVLITSGVRMKRFKDYLRGALSRYFFSRRMTIDAGDLRFIVDVCFDRIPDFPRIRRKKVKYYRHDMESWRKTGGKSGFSSFKDGKKTRYALELEDHPIEVFDAYYGQLKDNSLSLYRTRMKFRTSDPSGSYTYRRREG